MCAEDSLLADLADTGIPVWLEIKYQNAHDKIVLIDPESPDGVVITGSFNFTWTAQHMNAENILMVRGNSCLTSRFLVNWQRRQKEASPYEK
jgi:phosphatidylserine/phosphatidylglycerophosphate/cardiolipin synthase-like enzyme